MQKAFCRWSAALVAGCLSSAGAGAQVPQAGGLPAVAERVTTLESQAAATAAQITTLKSAVANLQSSNTSVISAISSLTSAVNSLTLGLNAERNDRLSSQQFISAQIAALSSAISAERNDRVAADDALRMLTGGGIATFVGASLAQFLPNGDETKLSNLQLPAGKYFLTAKADVGSLDVNHDWDCKLYLNGQTLLDRANFLTESLGLGGTSAAYENFSLHSVTTLTAPGSIDFQCSTGTPSSIVRNISLIGLKLGS